MSSRKPKSNKQTRETYVATWDARIDQGITPELIQQWYDERDERDRLQVPIVERVRLRDLIDPMESEKVS